MDDRFAGLNLATVRDVILLLAPLRLKVGRRIHSDHLPATLQGLEQILLPGGADFEIAVNENLLLITDFGEQIRQTQENKAQPVIAWWLRSR